MFKYGLFEVVKYGREAEDKAYRERAAQILKRYGLEEKIWQVDGRTVGQVFLEWGPFESRQQADELMEQIFSDEEWVQLQAEREKTETIVPGTMEMLILNSYL